MEVNDNKEIVSEKVKNKNKSVRNYIVVTTFQWGCWDDKGGQNLQYQFYSRSLFFFFFLIKKNRFGKIKSDIRVMKLKKKLKKKMRIEETNTIKT